ncbi:hypothetical protein LEP1GSC195_2104 [Leptospira wolbachii serovar Codice str. CDC]|uniref:Uncharacterized protein n=1 Tax=Leptospira wolbachii serovar Codice str. CDC TaxID=1218599 RepID=R9A2X5_9LEPT|nr:hypothetical protein LEP1GSC195_2104 [Leptospira wolbachii serovar Codice str. CDC]
MDNRRKAKLSLKSLYQDKGYPNFNQKSTAQYCECNKKWDLISK